MENASKALIIAGAILLSILIISLGIMIYNQAAGVVNNNAMDELEVNQFNQKFSQYFGDHVRGANVNALINSVRSNNNTQDDGSRKINIVVGQSKQNETKVIDNSETESFTYPTAKTGSTYIVAVSAYTSAGLISEITIVENK